MSTSPFLSAAARVVSSGKLRRTSRLMLGALAPVALVGFQYELDARVEAHELVGPAPIGAFLKPSSPTFSMYFLGTTQPAPVADVP
jgi:hypothetical protein